MSIDSVMWTTFCIPFVTDFSTTHGQFPFREGVIVRISSNGFDGYGEGSQVPGFGNARVPDIVSQLTTMARTILGLDVGSSYDYLTTTRGTNPAATAACAAIETALCDLEAQGRGMSLTNLLGGATSPVPVNALVAEPETDAAVVSAQSAVRAGFRTIKLKVGRAKSTGAEVDRVGGVRAAIGPDIQLRLDANGAWDTDCAIATIHCLEAFDLELIEQPVAADNLQGMAAVRKAVDTPIAADESVGTIEQAHRAIAAQAADILVVKPIAAGGLRRGKAILELASQAGLKGIVTTSVDTQVGNAAALALASTLPEPRLACGLATGPLLASSLAGQGLAIRDGFATLFPDPGLGFRPDPEEIRRYTDGWHLVAE